MCTRSRPFIVIICLFLVCASFRNEAQKNPALFTLMKPGATGLKFTNNIREDDSLHVLLYEYLYNGHGIGIGDFNNDGLQDIFISGNSTPSKLFLNQGELTFEDVAKAASVRGNGTWSTGVSVADVNGDGLLDIYVCHSGKYAESQLVNELFINMGTVKGVPHFKESAHIYGLDAPGSQSTQAAFFDYDKDGDLDMFLLNHSIHTYYAFLNTKKVRATPDYRYGNRLFRNDSARQPGQRKTPGPVFTDVTLKAGIINNPLNYGLSVNISDINQDGWPDVYTTSDYSEQDYYYVNNGDGTFAQSLEKSFQHISKFSMGADIADINNDALPDVFTLDMLPEDNHRQKLLRGPDMYDQYHLQLDSGYYRQHMRNMLHLNQGEDSEGNIRFSEIAQLAGVSNTDWSWSALFADFDGDGWKDLMVTNGYLRDFTDLDFLKYTMSDAQLKAASAGNQDFKTYELVKKMPSNKLGNYLFKNNGDLTFRNVSSEWGFDTPTISNAAAYADLDNDGDLDLVIGQNNEPVQLFRNNNDPGAKWLQVQLKGEGANRFGLGTKLWLYAGKQVQYVEQYPVRGFQSTVTPVLHFSVPSGSVDSLLIEWPYGKKSVLRNLKAGQSLTLAEADARVNDKVTHDRVKRTLFTESPPQQQIPFVHIENNFVDFQVEVLMPYQLSRMGPALARADVNADGNDDVFIGGAIGRAGELYLQGDDGRFTASLYKPWKTDAASEDVNALFFDADNDNDRDLLVVSGGNEYEDGAIELQDRLYLNDGKGSYTKAVNALPAMRSNKHAIAAGDFDADGDADIFIGGRGKAGFFPTASPSYLLRNDSKNGEVLFTDVTGEVNPMLRLPGMVTVASWSDFNGDGFPELVLAGDWMPCMLFKNERGKLKDISQAANLSDTHGQWSALLIKDIDDDGDQDIVAGNCGLNNQFKASQAQPMTIHVNDFDGNGNIDPVISYFIQDKSYPMASRDELLDQIPVLKKKYIKYKDYADATLESIFEKKKLEEALVLKCTESKSVIFFNDGDLAFNKRALPVQAQFSKPQSILADDYDDDGYTDLLLFGNFFSYRTQLGESDASLGLLLRGTGNGKFEAVLPSEAGLFADGDVRGAVEVKNTSGQRKIVIAKNNDRVQVITIEP
jgi:enediyne biosynthesis protein E4